VTTDQPPGTPASAQANDALAAHLQLQRPGFALDVAFARPSHGVTVVFGPSGAGKTTLLRALAGLEAGAQGQVWVDGVCWHDSARGLSLPAHARAVGYVFQDGRLFSHLSVEGNLRFAATRAPRDGNGLTLTDAVHLLDLQTLLPRAVDGLSGGERQRVALARALLTRPRLLLLDEPLAALDAARKHELMAMLERVLGELDLHVLLVSHASDEVARLAQHMVLLQEGRVLAEGDVSTLLTRLDLPLAHGDTAAAVLDAVVQAHHPTDMLAQLEFDGGTLWVPSTTATPGQRLRVRIQARDVSVALSRAADSSILNLLPAQVEAIAPDAPGQVMVRLRVGHSVLLARVTQRSVRTLALAPGCAVVAQVKGVAIVG
jgi:molybdate transport system ATP-binding protein